MGDRKEELGLDQEKNGIISNRDVMGARRKRVLVVDDEKETRFIISEVMSRMGFEVVVAKNGLEALDLFFKNVFDLVLTDLQMPGMDGCSLARHIKEESFVTPVILITGLEEGSVREKAQGTGIDQVIYKPFSLRELESAVEMMVGEGA